jgi:hypothetical protein
LKWAQIRHSATTAFNARNPVCEANGCRADAESQAQLGHNCRALCGARGSVAIPTMSNSVPRSWRTPFRGDGEHRSEVMASGLGAKRRWPYLSCRSVRHESRKGALLFLSHDDFRFGWEPFSQGSRAGLGRSGAEAQPRTSSEPVVLSVFRRSFGGAFLAHRLSLQFDAMGVVYQSIQNAIRHRRLADLRVPSRDGQLTGK